MTKLLEVPAACNTTIYDLHSHSYCNYCSTPISFTSTGFGEINNDDTLVLEILRWVWTVWPLAFARWTTDDIPLTKTTNHASHGEIVQLRNKKRESNCSNLDAIFAEEGR